MALAEHRRGAARGLDHVICLAVGTGVGGALILDGRLYQGARGLAGLLGHTVLHHRGRRCTCGKIGCLEAYAAGPRIEQEYCRLARLPTRRRVPLEQVAVLARAGDAAALEAIRRGVQHLGAEAASLANALNPRRSSSAAVSPPSARSGSSPCRRRSTPGSATRSARGSRSCRPSSALTPGWSAPGWPPSTGRPPSSPPRGHQEERWPLHLCSLFELYLKCKI